jgi:hypothetical protein
MSRQDHPEGIDPKRPYGVLFDGPDGSLYYRPATSEEERFFLDGDKTRELSIKNGAQCKLRYLRADGSKITEFDADWNHPGIPGSRSALRAPSQRT